MRTRMNRSYIATLALLLFALISWTGFAGPKSDMETVAASTNESNMQLSGQELWSMNCQRCHNMRSPVMYTGTQWQVIVHHMRIRANITGEDARAIAEFLKSGSP